MFIVQLLKQKHCKSQSHTVVYAFLMKQMAGSWLDEHNFSLSNCWNKSQSYNLQPGPNRWHWNLFINRIIMHKCKR